MTEIVYIGVTTAAQNCFRYQKIYINIFELIPYFNKISFKL